MSRTTTRAKPTHPTTVEPTVDEPFVDEFLSRWINAQLGGFERRGIIRISLQTVAPARAGVASLENAAGRITAKGGTIIENGRGRLMGIWGAQQGHRTDCRHALEAAISIARDGDADFRVLLEIIDAVVAKEPSDGVLADSDDGATSWEYVVSALPQGVNLTQTFRNMAGLGRGLLALSTARIDVADSNAVLYALPVASEAALEKILDDRADDSLGSVDTFSPAYLAQLNRLDGLGDLKAVVIIAAITGKTFSAHVLAHILGIEAARLGPALKHGVALQLFAPIATSGHRLDADAHDYQFVDGALHRVAYGLVPEDDRRRLHAKAAEALVSLKAGDGGTAEQVAAHHRGAANIEQSMRWLGKAAWEAIEQGETARAIAHLEAALGDASIEAGSGRTQQHLMQLLGVQIALARGNASERFFDLYQRSLDVVCSTSRDQSNGSEFRALWGLQSYHLVRGEVHAALTIGQMILLRFVEAHRDGSADSNRSTNHYKLLANRMQGLATMLDGQLDAAERHYEIVLGSYDTERDASLRFAFGSDQAALALAHRGWTRTLKGDAAGARDDAAKARRHAERLQHAHTSAHVLGVLSLAALQAGSLTEAALRARETHAVASEHALAYWIAWSRVILAATHAQNQGEQLRAMTAACADYEGQNATQLLAVAYGSMGEIALAGDRLDQAQVAIEKGLSLSKRGGVRVQRPRLGLIQARILRALGDHEGATASLEAAYRDAKTFGANLFLRQITIDGFTHSDGQDQILWQRRYHAAV